MKNKFLTPIILIGLSGCASNYDGPSSNATELATEQFRKDILKLSSMTIKNTKKANDILMVKSSETDLLDDPNLGALTNIASLSYLNGVYISTFKNLVEDISSQADYEYTFTTSDPSILNKSISISGDNIRLIDALYTAESKFGENSVDITINTKTKRIVVGDFSNSSNGMRELTVSPAATISRTAN